VAKDLPRREFCFLARGGDLWEVSSPPGDVSIAVSVFNNCRACDAAALLRAVALPESVRRAEGTEEGLRRRVRAVAEVVVATLKELGLGAKAFLQQMCALRFSHLGGYDSARCPRRTPPSAALLAEAEATAHGLSEVVAALEASSARSGAPAGYTAGVTRVLVSNYVEDLAAGAVGPQRSALFLQCLAETSA